MNDKGVTTGEVQAHLAEISGVQVSRDTISTIIYVINVKIRDGTVANRPICAAIWRQLREHDVTHLNAGRRHLHPPRIRTRAGTDSGRQVVTILRGGGSVPEHCCEGGACA